MTRRALLAGGAGGAAVVAFTAVPHGYADVRGFVAKLPRRPQVLSYGNGAHTRADWDSVTLPAFAFLGGALRHGGAA